MGDQKLKECKFCGNKTLLVEFLGKDHVSGNKLFSVVCSNGCTNYVYSYNNKTKKYITTGNLNRKVKQ